MHNDMMKCKPVYAWLEMAQDDDVLIDPDDINHEAINNMCSFSPTEDETPQIHAADIVEFIGELIAARSLGTTVMSRRPRRSSCPCLSCLSPYTQHARKRAGRQASRADLGSPVTISSLASCPTMAASTTPGCMAHTYTPSTCDK